MDWNNLILIEQHFTNGHGFSDAKFTIIETIENINRKSIIEKKKKKKTLMDKVSENLKAFWI